VAGLTYALADATQSAEAGDVPPAMRITDPRWRRVDLILSVVLVLCVGLIWWYFS
jgi:hypothetical protein